MSLSNLGDVGGGVVGTAGRRVAQAGASSPASESAPGTEDGSGAAPAPDPSVLKSALGKLGAGIQWMVRTEQAITQAIVPNIPGLCAPAVCIGHKGVGMPHGHLHPPNLIPPAPMVLLSSLSAMIRIPYISGAETVLIGARNAARCGDMSAALWCGGAFPLAEKFLGSSTVWIEGSRAARVGIDINKHCTFMSPRPQDPPVGPPIGTTIECVPNVLIGGIPMPSLTGGAIGAMFMAIFKGVGTLGRALRKKRGSSNSVSRAAAMAATQPIPTRPPRTQIPKRLEKILEERIDELLADGTIKISASASREFVEAARRDLRYMLSTPESRQTVNEIQTWGRSVTIEPPDSSFDGAFARAASRDASVLVAEHRKGVHRVLGENPNIPAGRRVRVIGRGKGSDTIIQYDPLNVTKHPSDRMGSPSDSILNHEFGHALNNARGADKGDLTMASNNYRRDQEWRRDWANAEEFSVVRQVDNPYRRRWGLEERSDYTSPLPKSTPHSKTPTLYGDPDSITDWVPE